MEGAEAWYVVKGLELKAATSWCQNFPTEGHFRDSISSLGIRDGGSHGFRGVYIDTDGLAGSERFKNDLFQNSETGTPRHNSESPGGAVAIHGRRCWRGKFGFGEGRRIIDSPLYSLVMSMISVISSDPPLSLWKPYP